MDQVFPDEKPMGRVLVGQKTSCIFVFIKINLGFNCWLGGGFRYFVIFAPNLGEMIQFD